MTLHFRELHIHVYASLCQSVWAHLQRSMLLSLVPSERASFASLYHSLVVDTASHDA